MASTASRLLSLLALLQGRRVWTSAGLADRLGVDTRTIRRDVDRLRDIGYVIEASAGPGGGYRLTAGDNTPPLLLDDDEAVAVATALSAATGSVAGMQEVSLRALVKLEQLLPPRLRKQLSALQAVTVPLVTRRPMANPFVLNAIANACQESETLKFTYRDRRGEASTRTIEPLRLVHTGRLWYLAAWDVDRGEWRTFRVDRIDAEIGVTRGARFVPREPPEDVATYVFRSIAVAPHRYIVRLRLLGTLADVTARVPRWVGVLESLDDQSCVLSIGAETHETIAAYIAQLGMDFTVLDPPELVEPIRTIALRMLRGTEDATAVSAVAAAATASERATAEAQDLVLPPIVVPPGAYGASSSHSSSQRSPTVAK